MGPRTGPGHGNQGCAPAACIRIRASGPCAVAGKPVTAVGAVRPAAGPRSQAPAMGIRLHPAPDVRAVLLAAGTRGTGIRSRASGPRARSGASRSTALGHRHAGPTRPRMSGPCAQPRAPGCGHPGRAAGHRAPGSGCPRTGPGPEVPRGTQPPGAGTGSPGRGTATGTGSREAGPRPSAVSRVRCRGQAAGRSLKRRRLPAGSRNAQSRAPHGWSVGSWRTSAPDERTRS